MVLERLMKVIENMQPVLQSLPTTTAAEEEDGEDKRGQEKEGARGKKDERERMPNKDNLSFQSVLHSVAYPEDCGAELKRLLMEGVDKRLEAIFTKNVSKMPDEEKLVEGKALLEKGCFVAHLLEKYLDKEEKGDLVKVSHPFYKKESEERKG